MDELWGKKVEKGKTENVFEMKMNKLVYKIIFNKNNALLSTYFRFCY